MKNFEICVRGVVFYKNKILICKLKKENFYFFPGGHLKFGEAIKEALFREFKEELGIEIKKYSLIGVVDNIFLWKRRKHHEFNFVFEILLKKIKVAPRERKLDFFLVKLNEFKKMEILPLALKKAILKWKKDKKFFWASQHFDKIILKVFQYS